jgi:hypothetical protein
MRNRLAQRSRRKRSSRKSRRVSVFGWPPRFHSFQLVSGLLGSLDLTSSKVSGGFGVFLRSILGLLDLVRDDDRCKERKPDKPRATIKSAIRLIPMMTVRATEKTINGITRVNIDRRVQRVKGKYGNTSQLRRRELVRINRSKRTRELVETINSDNLVTLLLSARVFFSTNRFDAAFIPTGWSLEAFLTIFAAISYPRKQSNAPGVVIGENGGGLGAARNRRDERPEQPTRHLHYIQESMLFALLCRPNVN